MEQTNEHRGPGRPPYKKEEDKATTNIHLRTVPRRKSAYVRAASSQGKTLADWVTEWLDAASGYRASEGQAVSQPVKLEFVVACPACRQKQPLGALLITEAAATGGFDAACSGCGGHFPVNRAELLKVLNKGEWVAMEGK